MAGTLGRSAPLAEFSGYFAYFEYGAYFAAVQKELKKSDAPRATHVRCLEIDELEAKRGRC